MEHLCFNPKLMNPDGYIYLSYANIHFTTTHYEALRPCSASPLMADLPSLVPYPKPLAS